MLKRFTLALTLGALIATGFDATAWATSKDTTPPNGCINRLGRDGNYICCGGPRVWICHKLPSKIPGKVM
ncbi:MAG: hypothetical protein ACTHOR_10745 [Devosia sp.]|jgi:hypothetical protein|nr:hypothetical protein [Devosiaceae bacterium]